MAEGQVAFWEPDVEHHATWGTRIQARSRGDELFENYFWSTLYDRSSGFYSGYDLNGKRRPANIWGRDKKGNLTRLKTRMGRREWVERHVRIVATRGKLLPLILNPSQRRLEAWILRMERARIPVRIQILKSRKIGFSTYIEACLLWAVLTGQNITGLIVTDTTERSEMVLNMTRIAVRELHKPESADSWALVMNKKRKDGLGWDVPINGRIDITSAIASAAGRGATPQWIHMSESAFWMNASDTLLGTISSLPMKPGTYAFDESTANGEEGKFYDDWQVAWLDRHRPLQQRGGQWQPVFFAWWEHDDYRWTNSIGEGREFPADMHEHIMHTLEEEEGWLLRQRYFHRGEGWKRVTTDQLAWRRAKIQDKDIGGDVNKFNQEYPSRPEVAFMSKGGQVFDRYKLQEYLKLAHPPVWRGTIIPRVKIANMPVMTASEESE